MVNRLQYTLLITLLFLSNQAYSVTISMNDAALDLINPINGSLRAQALENELNNKIFSGFDMELEVAAPTGGTTAVDDLAFEGPGLTVITGSGFILRWTNPVEQVRIGFSDFKDDFGRTVYAYDFSADYLRDQSQTSQSINGNVIGGPPTASAIDQAMGIVPAGGTLNLTVGGAGIGPISSVYVNTSKFLTSWLDVEFSPIDTPSPVPLPATAWLFLTAVGGLLGFRRFRKFSAPD